MIRIVIPGKPHAQRRARVDMRGKFAHMHDDSRSITWKAYAQDHLAKAIPEPIPGPLLVRIHAIYELPTSKHRKTKPVLREWHMKATGDVDNIAKAVLDAGNSVAWIDDREISVLEVSKLVGAQGEAPRTIVTVEQMTADPDWLTFLDEQVVENLSVRGEPWDE